MTGTGSRVERLAVLTVYLVAEPSDVPLLELQIERIVRHTTVPVTIHAVAPRVPPEVREELTANPAVRLLDAPEFPEPGSREHAHFLDLLLADARRGDASHFVTLDHDSFPIVDGWQEGIVALDPAAPVAGILRTENGDVCLPHPSCTLLDREFVEHHPVSFSPDSDGTPEFRRFLRDTGQAGDTGLRLAFELWRTDTPWTPLRRTNAVDLHYLIAGIYADRVFHLGAGTRAPVFRPDRRGSPRHRLTEPLARLPVGRGRARDAKKALVRGIRSPAERRLQAANQHVATRAREWLLADPDGLIAHLRGA